MEKTIKNNLYINSIIIIVFIFLAFNIITGCNIRVKDQPVDGKEAQVEEEIEETATIEEADSEVNEISVEEVYEIIESGQDYIILDVRTPDEFNEAHIEGAVLIPVLELNDKLNELPKDKPIITYCLSGSRSRDAANILVENGYKQVYDMGGILEWMDKGYPVVIEEN
jgi:phage shock protein E